MLRHRKLPDRSGDRAGRRHRSRRRCTIRTRRGRLAQINTTPPRRATATTSASKSSAAKACCRRATTSRPKSSPANAQQRRLPTSPSTSFSSAIAPRYANRDGAFFRRARARARRCARSIDDGVKALALAGGRDDVVAIADRGVVMCLSPRGLLPAPRRKRIHPKRPRRIAPSPPKRAGS